MSETTHSVKSPKGTSKSVKKFYNWATLLIVVLLVVILNIIGSFLYSRLDMTEDSRYSLGEGTISFLEDKEQIKKSFVD